MKDGQGIQLISNALIDEVRRKANQSPRLRQNHNFHTGAQDNPHRFLNVLLQGTYVTPHRHSTVPKAEGFLVLEGCAAAYIFDDDGRIKDVVVLSADGTTAQAPSTLKGCRVARGIDLPPGVWHTIVALSPSVVCYEVKPGPWVAATDKEFAPWAPLEDAPGAAEYLAALVRTTV